MFFLICASVHCRENDSIDAVIQDTVFPRLDGSGNLPAGHEVLGLLFFLLPSVAIFRFMMGLTSWRSLVLLGTQRSKVQSQFCYCHRSFRCKSYCIVLVAFGTVLVAVSSPDMRCVHMQQH